MVAQTQLGAQDTIRYFYKDKVLSAMLVHMPTHQAANTHLKRTEVSVFDRAGNTVFKGETRNYFGHSSIDLSFHANGGVSKIETSSAPDGGIQWYKSTYMLDENGQLIDFREQSHEDLLRPSTRKLPREAPLEVPEKGAQLSNDLQTKQILNQLEIVNRTKRRIQVVAMDKNTPAASGKVAAAPWIKPGQKQKLAEYFSEDFAASPNSRYELYWRKNSKDDFQRLSTHRSIARESQTITPTLVRHRIIVR